MKAVNELIRKIRNGDVSPIYAFDGEETYYIDLLCDAFEESLLQPHEKDFNFTIFYGKDSTWSAVVNECRSYPAFAQRRLVILKEAADLKNLNLLESYVEQPLESTVLVIAHKHKKIDGRTSLLKTIKKHGVYLTFDKVRDYQLSEWILTYCNSNKIRITPANAELIGAYLGTDLRKIVNELDKVLLNVGPEKEISSELIERYIGISKEYNVFSYPKALLERNAERSYRIANYFIANPKVAALPNIAANVYAEFSKLYQFHYLKNEPDKAIAEKLKLNPVFVKDYRKAASQYNLSQTIDAIIAIQRFNLNAIGMHVAHSDMTLLKDFTAKLLSL